MLASNGIRELFSRRDRAKEPRVHDDNWCLRVEVIVQWSISRAATGNGIDFIDCIGTIGLGGSPGDKVQWTQLSSGRSKINWNQISVPT